MGQGLSDLSARSVMQHIGFTIDLISMSYTEFLNLLYNANKITAQATGNREKFWFFAIKKGSDATFRWKRTIRISCIRVNRATKRIESYRILTLSQFLDTYKMLVSFLCTNPVTAENTEESDSCVRTDITSISVILDRNVTESQQLSDMDDCCICMSKKPEIMMPCQHVFCQLCIGEWQTLGSDGGKCPICREDIDLGMNSWVIYHIPDKKEIETEIREACVNVSDKLAKVGDTVDSSDGMKFMLPKVETYKS